MVLSVRASASSHASFLSSKWTILATLIRSALLLTHFSWHQPWIEKILSNLALQSMLVRPSSTLDYWYELQAQFTLLKTVPTEYTRKPLLYRFLFPGLSQLESKCYSGAMVGFGIGILLLLLDFLIACFIEQLGTYLLHHEHRDQEEIMQPKIPKAIQPNRATIFGMAWDEGNDLEMCTVGSIPRSSFPTIGALLYFCSPLTILCGSQLSFQSLVYLGIIWTCCECARPDGNVSWAAFVLANVAYIEPFTLVMLIPCYLLTSKSSTFLASLSANFLCIHLLSFLLAGSFGIDIEFPIYSHPNLGPMWYFTMHVFPRFRPYFQIMFAGLPYLLVIPLAIRLYSYPVVLATCYWCVFAIFHSHPTTQDVTIALALMALSPRSLARTRLPSLISLCALPVPMLLYLLDCWMWLETGSGNANFIFFQCIAYQAFVANICIDFCGASVRRDKVLRLTAKLAVKGESIGGDAVK